MNSISSKNNRELTVTDISNINIYKNDIVFDENKIQVNKE
jgi:hypothetical protein